MARKGKNNQPAQEKPKKQRNPVVVVIVEGQSDQVTLEAPLTEALEAKYGEDVVVFFAQFQKDDGTYGGDVTSENGSDPGTIEKVMNKRIIMPCLKTYGLLPKYVTEIIHFVDTDGAFISDAQVHPAAPSVGLVKPYYGEDFILANDAEYIRNRNHRKCANIEKLLQYQREGFPIAFYFDNLRYGNQPTTAKRITPYSLYYFSCNLDHITYANANLDGVGKVAKANAFVEHYASSLDDFIDFLRHDEDDVRDVSYEESWELLRENSNSLHRHTNIGLLCKNLCGENVFDPVHEDAAG